MNASIVLAEYKLLLTSLFPRPSSVWETSGRLMSSSSTLLLIPLFLFFFARAGFGQPHVNREKEEKGIGIWRLKCMSGFYNVCHNVFLCIILDSGWLIKFFPVATHQMTHILFCEWLNTQETKLKTDSRRETYTDIQYHGRRITAYY